LAPAYLPSAATIASTRDQDYPAYQLRATLAGRIRSDQLKRAGRPTVPGCRACRFTVAPRRPTAEVVSVRLRSAGSQSAAVAVVDQF